MPAAYPVQSYRSGQRREPARGSQPARPPIPPRPANDNVPRLPKPANDNIPKSPGRATVGRTALRGSLRLASRAVPALGIALFLYELYQLYRGRNGGAQELNGGWVPCGVTCPQQGGWFTPLCPGICSQFEALTPGVNVFTDVNPGWFSMTEWWRRPIGTPGGGRFAVWRGWSRSQNGTTEVPHRAPSPLTDPWPQPYSPSPFNRPWYEPLPQSPEVPQFPPQLDPLSQPPFMPETPPWPIPWRVIPYRVPNPWRNPGEQPRWGPQPRPRPETPITRHPLAPPVVGQPGPTVTITPGQPSKEVVPRPGTRPTRPPRRDREKKVRAVLPVVIRKGLNAATEGCDAVEAFWKALVTTDGQFDKAKWRKRLAYTNGRKNPPCQGKAAAVYDLWEMLDAPEAVKNLVVNQVEDYAFGKIGSASKKGATQNQQDGIAPSTGRGFQSGPWDTWRPQVSL